MITLLATTAETAASPGAFEVIQRTFHLEWAAFLAGLINFIIVILVLKKFAFGPIQKMLEERRQRIADGEEKLKVIEQQLADSEKNTAAAIAKAAEEATRLVQEAKDSAHVLSEQKAQEAIAQAQQILSKAEVAAQADRDRLRMELKREFGKLVAATTAQVTSKTLSEEDHRRINEEALSKIEG